MAQLGGKFGLRLALAVAGAIGGVRFAIRRRRKFDLYDKVVLVTGGSRGLGLLLAREFANRGARVAICGRDEAELAEASVDLRKRGATFLSHVCDITRREDVAELVQVVRERFGDVDVLVNNAGVIQIGPMDNMTLEDYETAMRVHFWGPLYTTLEVLPSMRARKSGRIVNVSSIGGMVSVPHLLPYSASKFALAGLSEGLRTELMSDNVFVTTVSPGVSRNGSTQSADFKGQNEDEYAWFAVSEAFPGAAMRADSAAWRIVEATIYGDAEIVLSIPAKIAQIARALFPESTSETLALVNQVLPASPAESPDDDTDEIGSELYGVPAEDSARSNGVKH
jgi:NAD(P)-dependent dehydrogenase (short-subunit alcohol dehydrogenase family)